MYEWLTNNQLDIENSQSNYANLLDDKFYYTSKSGVKNSRTRITNNMLGNKKFCPMIRKPIEILDFEKKVLMEMAQVKLNNLHRAIDPELLGRSIEYLYTNETKLSTEIEKEITPEPKMRKFYRVLTTSGIINLSKKRLIDIQNEIEENIHFIGPKYLHVPDMMKGFLDNTLPPMMHAAMMSFGFVYIHPFSDGNGRIHRYLIHDVLKSRVTTKQDFIIPVSATILQRYKEYDEVLEKISKLVMALIDYEIDESDHSIIINNDINYMYRYPDLTPHVIFFIN